MKKLIPAIPLGVVMAVLLAGPAWALVRATPEVLTFTSRTESLSVLVDADGVPVPADDINLVKLYVDEHDYDEMFTVVKTDGKITLTPTEYLEIGSYDLVIDTDLGDARVRIYAPLSAMDDSIENRAARLGMTVEEYKSYLGLTSELRKEVTITVPPVVYEGQPVVVDLPSTPGRQYVWQINEKVVAEGPEANKFRYVFEEPGDYVVVYRELADGQPVGSAVVKTTVISEPPVREALKPGTSLTLHGPAGFQNYVWEINDEIVASDPALDHTFSTPGAYTIECYASDPLPGTEPKFRRIRYNITVAP